MKTLPKLPARAALCGALLTLLPSCAQRVWMMVPPPFELGQYQRIGLVEFHGSDPALCQQATRQFQELVLEARPGSQLVQLGGEALGEGWSPDGLDPEAARDLAQRHGLDAVFVGALEMSKTTPTVGFSTLATLDARAEVSGTMSARLIEAGGGATVWGRSAQDRATVASGGFDSQGDGSFAMTDPAAVRSAMVCRLAGELTHDFRARYLRKRLEDIPPGYRVTYPEGEEVYVPPEAEQSQR